MTSSVDLVTRAGRLKRLFEPDSVAVIGASHGMERIGGRPIEHMRRAGFAGRIYPVNPKYQEIAGLPCYPSLAAAPRPVDLAILAISAERIPEALHACATAGVRAAIIFSAGFAELSDAGRGRQATISEFARRSGISLLGPNCLGALDFRSRLMATFTLLDVGTMLPGSIGFVSQSGLAGTYFLTLAHRRGMTFSKWIATGNEADITAADCIAYLAQDADTRIIVGFIEGVHDGARFCESLSLAQHERKPVLLVKVGRSEAGARAAVSHTAALVGDDDVFAAVCRRYGACRAHDLDEMLDVTEAFTQGAVPSGGRLCIVTLSGGVGVMMADEAVDGGLELPELPEPHRVALRVDVPYAPVANPVDLTAQLIHNPGILEEFLDTSMAAGVYDAIVTFLGQVAGDRIVVDRYLAASERRRIPYFLCGLTSATTAEELRRRGIPLFESPTRAVRTIAALARLRAILYQASPPAHRGSPLISAAADAISRRIAAAAGADRAAHLSLGEWDSRELLELVGLPVVPGRLTQSADQAVLAADEIGYPVGLKLSSADIPHKSEVGGVVLGIGDEATLREAYTTMLDRVRRSHPGERLDGIQVQQMSTDGLEVLLGIKRDPIFGPVVTFGAGGIYAEWLAERQVELCPVSPEGARGLIGRTRIGQILRGQRGQAPFDLTALAEMLSRLSCWAVSEPRLQEVDLNPVLVRRGSLGVVALDALVILSTDPVGPSGPE